MIIDNYSRYIINWAISFSKESIHTKKLIQKAKLKIKEQKSQTQIYMDQGSENTVSNVNKVFLGHIIKQVFASIDVKYSNSMVESFFRSLKNNFLYPKNISTLEQLREVTQFYIKEHNTKIPHNAFSFATTYEVYNDKWTKNDDAYIQKIKKRLSKNE